MIGILFLVGTLALIGGAIYYLSKRFSLFFNSSVKVWLWTLGCISVSMIVAQPFTSMASNTIGMIANAVSSFWMLSLLYLVLSIAFVDLISLVIKTKPSVRKILSFGIYAIVMIYGIFSAYHLKVKEVTIPIDGLTKEIRAVHITDVHLGSYRGKNYLEKVVGKAIELNPDVIFNTGDLFDNINHFHAGTDILEPFRKIAVPHYFVDGNHDQYVGANKVFELAKEVGAITLQNEIADFGELQIIGLNNMAKDSISFDLHTVPGSETIQSVLENLEIDENRPTLVLHHRPDGVEYMQPKGVDLLLSGHTHAGQLFPFTIVTKFMFRYNKGLYHYENMAVYVSEGVGTIFFPFRLGTHGDITLVILTPKR